MKNLTILVVALVAGGWLSAAAADAEVKADKKDAPPKKEAKGEGEKKTPEKKEGGKKDVLPKKEGEKKDASRLSSILKEDELALLEKNYPKLVKDREVIEELQAEFKALKEVEDPRERKKAERKIPAVHKKLTRAAEALESELEKSLKPMDSQWARLKDQEERLTKAKDSAETAGKDTAKITADQDALIVQLTDLDKVMTALKTLCDVKVEKLEEKK